MHSLWPTPPVNDTESGISDVDLERTYAYPSPLTAPWVQVNFIASADGAATVHGTSRGLASTADKRIFALGRDLADVVLVGAGTAVEESYSGVKPSTRRNERRHRLGRAELPPIAVVSNSCSIPPDAPVLTETTVPPIVLTCRAAPAERRESLRAAGAEILITGDERVDLPTALHELGNNGLYRVNCEGGPHLFGSMLADDLVDQLCLTLAPLLTGPGSGRIIAGTMPKQLTRFDLGSVLHEDGYLMLRYRKRTSQDA